MWLLCPQYSWKTGARPTTVLTTTLQTSTRWWARESFSTRATAWVRTRYYTCSMMHWIGRTHRMKDRNVLLGCTVSLACAAVIRSHVVTGDASGHRYLEMSRRLLMPSLNRTLLSLSYFHSPFPPLRLTVVSVAHSDTHTDRPDLLGFNPFC